MQIGTFRRNVGKIMLVKPVKLALKGVAKSSPRTLIAQSTVNLKITTGRLLQVTSQYVLGSQQTQEMKDDATQVLGGIGFNLTALSRVLKVKMPASTSKKKLVGTRTAAILQLDSLATDLLYYAADSLFMPPKMNVVTKMVAMPQKGGEKESRPVSVVDTQAEEQADIERQAQMRSYLTGALDVYWRLVYDMTGQPPVGVIDAEFLRMKQAFPGIQFDTAPKAKVTPKAAGPVKVIKKAKTKAKAAAEVVPA